MEKTLNMSCIEYLRPDRRETEIPKEQQASEGVSSVNRRSQSGSAERISASRTEVRGDEQKKSVALSRAKKLLMKFIMAGIFITILWGAIAAHAGNKNTSYTKDEYVYKMIVVEDNETLWSLGKKWGSSTADDIRTWIRNVEEMNCMNNDQIRYGQELLIYCGESMKDAHR